MGLEQRGAPVGHALDAERQQGAQKIVQMIGGAVVGVQGDLNRVLLGDLVGVGGERNPADGHVAFRRT